MKNAWLVLALVALAAAPAGGAGWVRQGPPGGPTGAIAVDPMDPLTAYVTSGGTGVFKTSDGGTLWTKLPIGTVNGFLWDVTVDPSRAGAVWVAAGAAGVLHSGDGGASWSQTRFPKDDGSSWIVVQVVFARGDASIAYVGTRDGALFQSRDAGDSWLRVGPGLGGFGFRMLVADPTSPLGLYAVATNGFILKTTDGGLHWAQTRYPLGAGDPQVLRVDPGDPQRLFAGVSGRPQGLWRSDDAGQTWVQGTLDGWVLDLAFVPGSPRRLLAVTGGVENRVQRSDDGGATWAPLALDDAATHVAVSSPDGALVYATTTITGVVASRDLGATWTAGGLSAHTIAELVLVPGTPRRLYAATESGAIFEGVPGDAGWTATRVLLPHAADGRGSGATVYGLAWDAGTGTLIAADANATLRTGDGGASWLWTGALPGVNEFFPIGFIAKLVADGGTPGRVYAGHTNVGVLRSEDDGATWRSWNDGLTSLQVWALAVEPSAAATVYAGTVDGKVFRRRPDDPGWADVSPGGLPARVYALAASPGGLVFASTTNGLFGSTDGGDHWTPAFASLEASGSTLVTIDPVDPMHVLAVVSFYADHADALAESRDGGATWTRIGPRLRTFVGPDPDPLSAKTLLYDPASPVHVYVGTYGDGVVALTPVCGDGVRDPGEACDDGSMTGSPGSRCPVGCGGATTTTTTTSSTTVAPPARSTTTVVVPTVTTTSAPPNVQLIVLAASVAGHAPLRLLVTVRDPTALAGIHCRALAFLDGTATRITRPGACRFDRHGRARVRLPLTRPGRLLARTAPGGTLAVRVEASVRSRTLPVTTITQVVTLRVASGGSRGLQEGDARFDSPRTQRAPEWAP